MRSRCQLSWWSGTIAALNMNDLSAQACGMIGLLCFVVAVLASPFKSKIRLEAENAAL
jgi:hypothetical protein